MAAQISKMLRTIVIALLAVELAVAQEPLETEEFLEKFLELLVPEPLPAVTPPDVVNLLLPGSIDKPGDIVASVVAANETHTTFSLECNPHGTRMFPEGHRYTCNFDKAVLTNPRLHIQGPSTMIVSHVEASYIMTAWEENCTFNGTTAGSATCTMSYAWSDSSRADDTLTMLYENRPSGWAPPFIPVQITAGLEKLASLTADISAETTVTITMTSTSTTFTTVSQTPTANQVSSTPVTITPAAILASLIKHPLTQEQALPRTRHAVSMLLSVNSVIIISVFAAAVVFTSMSVYRARMARF